MSIINPNAAGIDIGGKAHHVAVGQTIQQVKEFGVYAEDLGSLGIWLKSEGIKIIADICSGNLDPKSLSEHRHYNCRKSKEEIAKALVSNKREDYLFGLKYLDNNNQILEWSN